MSSSSTCVENLIVVAHEPWPKSLLDQVRTGLEAAAGPVTAEQLSAQFQRARVGKVEDLLETLASLGHARRDG